MKRFILELRRREVFRTAGLYVGICWILIEASSVMLPTFGLPEWILQWIIVGTFVGFPVMLVLAWVFDVTDKGIEIQEEATETVVIPVRRRRMDFVVIGVLAVALVFSLYMNVTEEPVPMEDPDPVSVLIADFDNQTGNALFNGLLEQALNIGIESAPHVTAFERNNALAVATRLAPSTEHLDTAAATLVAVREGIALVLAGTIQSSGSGFELQVNGVDPAEGRTLFEITGDASSPEAVLQVVGELSQEVREELGDTTLGQVNAISETFSAASLEAAKAYTDALQLAYEGAHEEAVAQYRLATELDENFGRAYSGWALSEFKLGKTEEATELWDKSLSLMETMTERERLRTLGLYYATVTGNFENAVQSFTELIEKYPADAAARNNLAVSAFLTLDFETASEQGRELLQIYPTSQLYQSNYALFAMYSGEFAESTAVSNEMIEADPGYGVPYLPLAMAAIDAGDAEAARDAYGSMMEAERGTYRASTAWLGLADVAAYTGNFAEAREHLRTGIELDRESGDDRSVATKNLAMAEMFAAEDDRQSALDAIASGLELGQSLPLRVPAALLYLQLGDTDSAAEIAAALAGQLQPQSRAYGHMLNGMISREAGRHVEAIDEFRAALEFADLWLIRRELGKAFLEGEFYAEALSEFQICFDRRGEATAIFLDDMPTYRYLATLPYWRARAEQALGMQSSSIEGFETFLSLRPDGGPLVDDAHERLQ